MTALVKLRRLVEDGRQPWDLFHWSAWAPAPRDTLTGDARPEFFELQPFQHRATVDLAVELARVAPAFLDLWETARAIVDIDNPYLGGQLLQLRAVLDRLDAIEEKKP